MEAYDALGHVAYALILYGNIRVGQRRQAGWAARFIGESIWVALGFYLSLTSVWFWGLVFCCIDLKNYYDWKSK